MDLQTRKIAFVQEFLKVQSEEVVLMLEKLLRKENKTSKDDGFESMSIQEFNERIDKSMEDSKLGRLIEANDLKAKIDKWN